MRVGDRVITKDDYKGVVTRFVPTAITNIGKYGKFLAEVNCDKVGVRIYAFDDLRIENVAAEPETLSEVKADEPQVEPEIVEVEIVEENPETVTENDKELPVKEKPQEEQPVKEEKQAETPKRQNVRKTTTTSKKKKGKK